MVQVCLLLLCTRILRLPNKTQKLCFDGAFDYSFPVGYLALEDLAAHNKDMKIQQHLPQSGKSDSSAMPASQPLSDNGRGVSADLVPSRLASDVSSDSFILDSRLAPEQNYHFIASSK